MKKNIFFTIIILFILFAIILDPKTYIQTTLNALNVWAMVLLPSLLPFFIFTKILTKLGTVKHIANIFSPISVNIYKNSKMSAYAFFMSILTGYPVGCKLVADLYHCGDLTKNQAKKSLCFCSNSGPMFILGSVGISMLFSKSSGYILLVSHILGALINGLFYRNIKSNNEKPYETSKKQNNTENLLSSSVMDSITSILLVGGMIVLCFICITIIENLNLFSPVCSFFELFNVDKPITNSILSGVFEITKGCLDVSNLSISLDAKTIICSFLISFGGFSTIMQAMAFVKDITSYKFMILQKTTHAIFSCAVCCVILLLI